MDQDALLQRVSIEGNGPPLVLVHGACGPQIWDLMLADLYEHFQVVVPTLPGFLPGDGPIAYSDRLQVEFLEEVRRALDFDRWAVAGHSMGGRPAIDYALAHRERTTHLIIIDSTGAGRFPPLFSLPLVRHLVPPLIAAAYARHGVWARSISREVTDAKSPVAAWAVGFMQNMVADPVVRGNVARAIPRILAPKREWPRLLPSLEVPSLVLWGSDDPTAPKADAYRLASYLPHCRLEVLGGLRHSGLLEAPGFFSQYIIEFVHGPGVKTAIQ